MDTVEQLTIGRDGHGKVFLKFATPIVGLKFTPEEALAMAEKLTKHAHIAQAENFARSKAADVPSVVQKLN